MPSSSARSWSSTKLRDSALRRSSSAASSSTRRRTSSEIGSASACEKTARRTGFTSPANASRSSAVTSSVSSAIPEYATRVLQIQLGNQVQIPPPVGKRKPQIAVGTGMAVRNGRNSRNRAATSTT